MQTSTAPLKPTREQIINENWYRGNLNYKRKPIQKRLRAAFNACKNFLFVCEVGRQTGKTYEWLLGCCELGRKVPNARMRFGTAYQEDVEEFVKPIMEQIIEDCPEHLKPVWKSKGSKYVFPETNAELKLFGIDLHPNGVRGNALHMVVIDEGGFTKHLKKVVEIIIFMLRHRPQLRVVLSSSTSETPDHDFTNYADQAALDGNYFKATIDDDETCDQATKDRIAAECGGYDSITYRREALCERVTDENLAIFPEWKDEYIQEAPRDEYFKYYYKYVSLDLGVVDLTAGLYAYYDFKRAKLFVIGETHMKGPQMTTDKLAAQIKAKEWELFGGKEPKDELCERCKKFSKDDACLCAAWESSRVRHRIGDNNNPLLLQDLSFLHGIGFLPTNKDELEAMVNETRVFIKAGQLIVTPACKMLLGCLKYGIYNSARQRREFARSKVYGHYDHGAALIYLVRNINRQQNPIPANLGIDPYSMHTYSNQPTATEKAWSEALGGKRFQAGFKKK